MMSVRCDTYLETVRRFAAANGLADQLEEKLDWLANYGNIGLPEGAPGRVVRKVTLFKDFAPYSFTFRIERPDENGGWREILHGGLIYEGPDSPADGAFPSLTVSVGAPRRGWYVHT